MRKLLLSVALTATILINTPAKAQVVVHDPTSFVESLIQGFTLLKQLTELKDQLKQMEKEYEAITGSRDIGSLAKTIYDKQQRRTLPAQWDDLIEAASTGDQDALSQLAGIVLNDLSSNYTMIDGAAFSELDENHARAVDRISDTTTVNMGIAEVLYNKTEERTETYETFLEKVNNTQDIKESIDLQARIAAENGILMNEMMRLFSAQLNQEATTKFETLVNDDRARRRNSTD